MKPFQGAPTQPRTKKSTGIPTQMWNDLLAAARLYPDRIQFRLAAVRIGNAYNWSQTELVRAGIIERLTDEQQKQFDNEYHATFPGNTRTS